MAFVGARATALASQVSGVVPRPAIAAVPQGHAEVVAGRRVLRVGAHDDLQGGLGLRIPVGGVERDGLIEGRIGPDGARQRQQKKNAKRGAH